LFVFSVGLCFGLRTKCLQSRHSTPWATLPVHFALVILEGGGLTNYLPGLSLNLDPPNFSLPSSQDYRCESPGLNCFKLIKGTLI
jgi:hypothetical protein